MNTTDAVNPSWNVVTIGRGSFANVSILTGRPVAFKQVLFPERTLELKAEFKSICKLYDLCGSDSFFAIPRPFAFFDPLLPNTCISSTVSPLWQGRRRAARPLVSHGDFKALGLSNAAYAMDQVLPLPLSTAQLVRKLFYPPGQEEATLPTLCRFYFGRILDVPTTDGRPTRFFNSANFPLDAARYLRLVATGNAEDYDKIEDIVYGMGEMLGRVHWFGGYDGRDIEFVMGGASFSGVSMNLIDFNQMRKWSKARADIQKLVDAFYSNDPYYPRARPDECLYSQFRLGYLAAYPEEAIEIAYAFLQAIEAEQAIRDSRR